MGRQSYQKKELSLTNVGWRYPPISLMLCYMNMSLCLIISMVLLK